MFVYAIGFYTDVSKDNLLHKIAEVTKLGTEPTQDNIIFILLIHPFVKEEQLHEVQKYTIKHRVFASYEPASMFYKTDILNSCDTVLAPQTKTFLAKEYKMNVKCFKQINIPYSWYGDRLKELLSNRELENKKTKFCCFIVTNPICSLRNDFFKELCKYKKVDSLGKYMNNVGKVIESGFNTPEFRKVISEYKFIICFENNSEPGYITEKLINAFLAGTVPIYYGDPLIDNNIKSDAYIKVKDRSDFTNAINKIKDLDQNDKKYNQTLSTVPLLPNTVTEWSKQNMSYLLTQALKESKLV